MSVIALAMFSGIVESNKKLINLTKKDQAIEIVVEKPSNFDDLSIGDSICCNGTCLTVESFDSEKMAFTLGYETLSMTNWNESVAKYEGSQPVSINLERSLRLQDRIHGHLVTGHVDFISKLEFVEKVGENLILKVLVSPEHTQFFWHKGSITINGVV